MNVCEPRLIKAVTLLTGLMALGFLSCTASKSSDQRAMFHKRMRIASDPESTPGELSDLFTNVTLSLQGMTNRLSQPDARADKQLYSKCRCEQVTMMLLAMNPSLPLNKLPEIEEQFHRLRENTNYILDAMTMNPDGYVTGISTNDFNRLFDPSFEEFYFAWEVLTGMQNGDPMLESNPFFSEENIREQVKEEGFQVTGEFNDLWWISFSPLRYLTQDIIYEMWNAPNLSTNQLRTIRANIASTKLLDRKVLERIIRTDDDPAYPSDLLVRLALSRNRNLPPDLALELLVNDSLSFKHGALLEPNLLKIFKGINVDVLRGTDLDPQTSQTTYWAKGPNGKVYLSKLPSDWDIITRTVQAVSRSDFPANLMPDLNRLIKAGMVRVDSSDTNRVSVIPGPQPKFGKEFSRVVGNENSADEIWGILIGPLLAYRQEIHEFFESLMKPKFMRGSFFTSSAESMGRLRFWELS